MNPAPDTEWSHEVNGLCYRCGTSQTGYRSGDKIVLRAGYRNLSGRPMVVLVNGNNLDEPGGLLQFAQSPLYSAERITITPESANEFRLLATQEFNLWSGSLAAPAFAFAIAG